MAELAQGQAVAHRHRARANEAFPAGTQGEALDRAAGGVGAIQDPDGFAMGGGGFEHVPERGDEGVDAAAEILQVDQQDVEGVHHGVGRAADFAIEAEHRDLVDGIAEIRALDHVVLLVTAQAVLGAEGGGEIQVRQGGQGVEGVGEVLRHRGRVGQQGDASASQRGAQGGVLQQAVEAESHEGSVSGSSSVKQSA